MKNNANKSLYNKTICFLFHLSDSYMWCFDDKNKTVSFECGNFPFWKTSISTETISFMDWSILSFGLMERTRIKKKTSGKCFNIVDTDTYSWNLFIYLFRLDFLLEMYHEFRIGPLLVCVCMCRERVHTWRNGEISISICFW